MSHNVSKRTVQYTVHSLLPLNSNVMPYHAEICEIAGLQIFVHVHLMFLFGFEQFSQLSSNVI